MTAPKAPDPLVIRHLEYLGPMATRDGWRPSTSLPEIAFVGRSNVGKSSLLNALIRRKSFARVSTTPGRTREIHFFDVNKRFILADLPGYGYARISKARKAEWRPLIEGYLSRSENLCGVVQLLDVRRDPTEDDMVMLEFLGDLGVPSLVAITKIDKLNASAAKERVEALCRQLVLDPDQVIPFSAKTGAGRDELATALVQLLEQSELTGSPDAAHDATDTEGNSVSEISENERSE